MTFLWKGEYSERTSRSISRNGPWKKRWYKSERSMAHTCQVGREIKSTRRYKNNITFTLNIIIQSYLYNEKINRTLWITSMNLFFFSGSNFSRSKHKSEWLSKIWTICKNCVCTRTWLLLKPLQDISSVHHVAQFCYRLLQ